MLQVETLLSLVLILVLASWVVRGRFRGVRLRPIRGAQSPVLLWGCALGVATIAVTLGVAQMLAVARPV